MSSWGKMGEAFVAKNAEGLWGRRLQGRFRPAGFLIGLEGAYRLAIGSIACLPDALSASAGSISRAELPSRGRTEKILQKAQKCACGRESRAQNVSFSQMGLTGELPAD
jgi:hypothetical protein